MDNLQAQETGIVRNSLLRFTFFQKMFSRSLESQNFESKARAMGQNDNKKCYTFPPFNQPCINIYF